MKRSQWLTNNNPEPAILIAESFRNYYAKIRAGSDCDVLIYFDLTMNVNKTVSINYKNVRGHGNRGPVQCIYVFDSVGRMRRIENGKASDWSQNAVSAMASIENITTNGFTLRTRDSVIHNTHKYVKCENGNYYELAADDDPFIPGPPTPTPQNPNFSYYDVQTNDPQVSEFYNRVANGRAGDHLANVIRQASMEFLTTGEVFVWQGDHADRFSQAFSGYVQNVVDLHTNNPTQVNVAMQINVTATVTLPSMDMTTITYTIPNDNTATLEQRHSAISTELSSSLQGLVGRRLTIDTQNEITESIVDSLED